MFGRSLCQSTFLLSFWLVVVCAQERCTVEALTYLCTFAYKPYICQQEDISAHPSLEGLCDWNIRPLQCIDIPEIGKNKKNSNLKRNWTDLWKNENKLSNKINYLYNAHIKKILRLQERYYYP